MVLFGIPINWHWSSLFLLFMVMPSFTLAGVLNGVLIFSLLMTFLLGHEISHCLAARKFGYETKNITVMALGGLAQITGAANWTNKEEAIIAVAGPLFNLVCAVIMIGLALLASAVAPVLIPTISIAIAINILLGVFNLIPAYPMDGGRILKTICYTIFGAEKGMKVAKIISTMFGGAMIGFGLFSGNIILAIIGGAAIFFTQRMGRI